MDRLREIEQEPNMPLAHIAREFGVLLNVPLPQG
jgi:hypothetical protein